MLRRPLLMLLAWAVMACSESSPGAALPDGATLSPADGGTSSGRLDSGPSDDAGTLPPATLRLLPDGAVFFEPITVRLEHDHGDATVHFTTDGSPPSGSSARWTGELSLSDSTLLRVVVLGSDGVAVAQLSRGFFRVDPSFREFRSNLPIVLIDAHGNPGVNDPERPRIEQPVACRFIDVAADGSAQLSGPAQHQGRCGMHIRGNSSVDYDKKQYKLETWGEDDRDRAAELLGMPSESDWVLHAPFSDKTLMRNVLMYGWSNAIGRYAPRTVFVEAFIDLDGGGVSSEDYVGVYVLMEKIKRDAHRVDVEKLGPMDNAPPELSGGYMLSKDWLRDGEENHFFTSQTYEDDLILVYPDPREITVTQREYIEAYVNEMEQALSSPQFADVAAGYAHYLDVDSFIDHHLLVELARNVDGFVLSTHVHKPRGGKLTMGPIWDFNGALGNADYFEAWETAGWHHENPEFPADNPHAYRWYARLFEDPAFVSRYAARYRELRQGAWADPNLLGDVDRHAQRLQDAAARNFERWPVLGRYVWPNPEGVESRRTYASEVAYLRDWLQRRLEWMDAQLSR